MTGWDLAGANLTGALGLMYETRTHHLLGHHPGARLMKTIRKILERLRLPLPALA
jgi:hypothetical protein